ncbi:DUF1289 domain-containing protein [Psychromonas sp.]|uniref:DUF1289 domain-containing protein n=1 Tax=Psychromonas sp. TaxID=1884585 RepID=UPI0039E24B7C
MSEIGSPCIRHCTLNKEDICIGCFRSLTEILHWREADDAQKKQILSFAQERQAKHN